MSVFNSTMILGSIVNYFYKSSTIGNNGKKESVQKPRADEFIPSRNTTLTLIQAPITTQADKEVGAIKDFILSSKVTPDAFFSEVFTRPLQNGYQFVLVGETHLDDENTSKVISSQLGKLKDMTAKNNEHLLVAAEIKGNLARALESVNDFNVSDLKLYEQIARDLIALDAPSFTPDHSIIEDTSSLLKRHSIASIYITAKRNGIPAKCVDAISNRDKTMMENITNGLRPNTRVVFYGGSAHCSLEPATYDLKNIPKYDVLGVLLSAKFGKDSVVSIRSANYKTGFDCIKTPAGSKVPQVDKFMADNNLIQPIIVPVKGPLDFNGAKNPRGLVHDYIFVDPLKRPE